MHFRYLGTQNFPEEHTPEPPIEFSRVFGARLHALCFSPLEFIKTLEWQNCATILEDSSKKTYNRSIVKNY